MDRGIFSRHLTAVEATYFAHQRSAFSFALRLALGAAACFIHGILPFLFVHTGSRQVAHLHERMVVTPRARSRQRSTEKPDKE
jgi:hypothetical protein